MEGAFSIDGRLARLNETVKSRTKALCILAAVLGVVVLGKALKIAMRLKGLAFPSWASWLF